MTDLHPPTTPARLENRAGPPGEGRFDGRRFPFAACGDDVTIYDWVRVVGAERTRIGHHVIVDDFVFLDGGMALDIGSHVHIAAYASIMGGATCVIGDFVGLCAGVRVVTGTDDFMGAGLTNPTIPSNLRSVHRGRVEIGRHVLVGVNSVVLPDVTIGEGAVVGAGSVVTRDLPPWTICVGSPARPVKDRRSDRILALEAELAQR